MTTFNQVGIGSESDCLLGQLDRISDSDAGVKEEKYSVVGEVDKCGDDVARLLERGINQEQYTDNTQLYISGPLNGAVAFYSLVSVGVCDRRLSSLSVTRRIWNVIHQWQHAAGQYGSR